jgi:hypothetical protein
MTLKSQITSLSPDLKFRLSLIKKDVQLTKNKLGRVLDLILQGNFSDIENDVQSFDQNLMRNDLCFH